MPADVIAGAFAVGGCGIAAWLLVRFPALGPRRLRMALLGIVLALVVTWVLPAAARPLVDVDARWGRPLALLIVVLPGFTLTFWLAGCLIRAWAATGGRLA